MKLILLMGILLLHHLSIFAQQNKYLPLSIGDTMPDITFSYSKNGKKLNAKFSDFKGKAVLIDFWFGACAGCIEIFPVLESLQMKYSSKLQIIAVNFESQDQIDATFKKHRFRSSSYKNTVLPSVVSDTIFHQLFPHQYYPHEVWIDASGVIRAFTTADEVTNLNIDALLNGRNLNVDMKIDNLDFNPGRSPVLKQLFLQYPNHLQYYSAVLKFVPGVIAGLTRFYSDSGTNTIRVTRVNMTVLELFSNALDNGVGADPMASPRFDYGKRVIMDVKEKGKYIYDIEGGKSKQAWNVENRYTYEAVVPVAQKANIFDKMADDLKQYFGVYCEIEKRKMKCLALIRISEADKIKSKTGKARSIEELTDSTKLELYAITTQWLVDKISNANKTTPFLFVDNTGYNGRIDIELDKKILGDISLLKKHLRFKYDLDLIESEQEMEVFVLKEIGEKLIFKN